MFTWKYTTAYELSILDSSPWNHITGNYLYPTEIEPLLSWATGEQSYIYIYIYIYIFVIHRQICFVLSELFSAARQARFPKLGSKILPLSHKETSASEGNLNGYESQLLLFTYIRLTATETSIHMKGLALR